VAHSLASWLEGSPGAVADLQQKGSPGAVRQKSTQADRLQEGGTRVWTTMMMLQQPWGVGEHRELRPRAWTLRRGCSGSGRTAPPPACSSAPCRSSRSPCTRTHVHLLSPPGYTSRWASWHSEPTAPPSPSPGAQSPAMSTDVDIRCLAWSPSTKTHHHSISLTERFHRNGDVPPSDIKVEVPEMNSVQTLNSRLTTMLTFM
jgi:hypothetical protein